MDRSVVVPHFAMEECVAGTVVYPPGGRYGPCYYKEIQLVLLHTGLMDTTMDDRSFVVRPGQALLIVPTQTVALRFHRETESWHRWITMTPAMDMRVAFPELYGLPCVSPLSPFLNQLADLLLQRQNANPASGLGLRAAIGLAALQAYAEDCRQGTASGEHPAVLAVKAFVGQHYARKLDLAELAQRASVSPGHLVRLFRETQAYSPIEFLWAFRVARGVELLRTSGLSVGEIAEQCGFSNPFHFARMVKKRTGHAPTALRAEHWRGEA